jgi:hypothetical protein
LCDACAFDSLLEVRKEEAVVDAAENERPAEAHMHLFGL